MRIGNSKLLSQSLLYGFANGLYSGLPILVLPVLLKFLQPGDFGLVDLFRNISLLLTPILGLSTVQSISRFYYELDERNFKTFVSNVIILHGCNAILGVLIYSILSFYISEEYSSILILSIVFFLFNQITEALLSIFQVQKKVKSYILIRLSTIILDITILYFLYLYLDQYDWHYRVIPNVSAAVLVGAFSFLFLLKKKYIGTFNLNLLKSAILFSSPLILHMISGYVMSMGDRFFILTFLNKTDLGNYAVSYQLGVLVNFLYTSFNLAWVPTYYEMRKKNEIDKIKKIRKLIFCGVAVFSIIVLLVVYYLLNNTDLFVNYDIKYEIVIILVVAYVLNSFYRFESNYFFYLMNTKTLSIITLGAALITVLINLILIGHIGIYACAFATLVAQAYMFFTVLIIKGRNNNLLT